MPFVHTLHANWTLWAEGKDLTPALCVLSACLQAYCEVQEDVCRCFAWKGALGNVCWRVADVFT